MSQVIVDLSGQLQANFAEIKDQYGSVTGVLQQALARIEDLLNTLTERQDKVGEIEDERNVIEKDRNSIMSNEAKQRRINDRRDYWTNNLISTDAGSKYRLEGEISRIKPEMFSEYEIDQILETLQKRFKLAGKISKRYVFE